MSETPQKQSIEVFEVLSASIVSVSEDKLIGEFVLDVPTNEKVISFSYVRTGNKLSFNSFNPDSNLTFSMNITGGISQDNVLERIKENFPPQFLESIRS